MSDNKALQELCSMLGMAHRAYLEEESRGAPSTGRTSDTHWMIRRLIESHPVSGPGDLNALLDAAQMARELDPDFAFAEQGSCVSLLRKAVLAIDQQHAKHYEAANELLSKLHVTDQG